MLLNAQSVCNKTELLEIYILQNCPDIFIITETWVPESDYVTFNALTPLGYVHTLCHSVLRNGRGGGIATFSKCSLGASLQPIRKFCIFECAELDLKFKEQNLRIIIIYRPTTIKEKWTDATSYMYVPGWFSINPGWTSTLKCKFLTCVRFLNKCRQSKSRVNQTCRSSRDCWSGSAHTWRNSHVRTFAWSSHHKSEITTCQENSSGQSTRILAL